MGVEVAVAAVERALRLSGGDRAALLVVGRHAEPEADLRAAVVTAAAAADADEGAATEWVATTPKGIALSLTHVRGRSELGRWCDSFAAALTAAGWDGTVKPVTPQWYPNWVWQRREPHITAHLARRIPAWRHDIDWVTFPGADAYLARDVFSMRVTPAARELEEQLTAAAVGAENITLTCVRERPTRIRHAHVGADRQSSFQVLDEETNWRTDVADVVAHLRYAPATLDLGVVRRSPNWVLGWADLQNSVPMLPFVEHTGFRDRRDLWSRYTPDAFGIQLLTAAHLEKTSELSRWRVEEVAPERFLVQAKDLAPWLAGPTPDPDVVAAARADFGAALLTDAVVAAL